MKASKKLLKFVGTMSDADAKNLIEAIEKCEKDTSDLEKTLLARKLEALNEWELAAEAWNEIGKTQDADMCNHIAKRIKERK